MSELSVIRPVSIEDEMQKSYLDYSMSTITSRALPAVCDGLKPVHRRVLFGMLDIGLLHNRPTKKCANVVGNVMAKFHPHGDSAIYDTLVRMAQPFSMRYPMITGQGNFGSVDGDPPAAMRYTECRLSALAEEMLTDIDKETVDFQPNYDDTTREPALLPAKIPFLLVNGSTGIAVGMATNMAPHNISEVMRAVIAVIDRPDLPFHELMKIIPGPDFPTGGIIYGRSGIVEAYKTGLGKVTVRARTHIETTRDEREQIVVTEIPFMVNKSTLQQKIADLMRQKVIDGISSLNDESDREGMRIVIGIKRDSYAEVVLNQLHKHTAMQSTFGINSLALVDRRPTQLSLRDLIDHFIQHRFTVVTRRTRFDLNKAKERAHILEGLKIALENIDAVIELIKASASPDEARTGLVERFGLSVEQARAILDMRLQRLTALEREKIETELRELHERIGKLTEILGSRELRMGIIQDEARDIVKRFGDPRRTEIVDVSGEVNIEDMIADEGMVITMSGGGYIKRCALSTYRSQGRGGRGIKGMDSKEDDYIRHVFVASAHATLLFFTTMGRCYWLRVYAIPEASRQSRGKPIVNLLNLKPEERVAAYVAVREFREDHYIIMATARGIINKQPLKSYANIRRDGINAISLEGGDRLVECKLTNGKKDIVLGSRSGQAVRFHESAVRELGRNTRGVRGIRLSAGDELVGMIAVSEQERILTVTRAGYGKMTPVEEYRRTNRGGSGIINIRCTRRNGPVVGLKGIDRDSDLILITRNGIIIRFDCSRISTIGRNTQGVRCIHLDPGDAVNDIALCEREENLMDATTGAPDGSENPGPDEGV